MWLPKSFQLERTTVKGLNESLMTTLFNATDNEVREEFGGYDAREVRGLRLSERKMAETRGRLISKIALLDEQYDNEQKQEIKDSLDIERRSLQYL
jgi:hypothetical protein